MEEKYEDFEPKSKNKSEGNGFSITALIVGICGLVFLLISCFFLPALGVILGIICGILGIVFGYKGRELSYNSTGSYSGMATAGFVLGIISLVLSTVGTLSCAACIGCSTCVVSELSGYPYYFY